MDLMFVLFMIPGFVIGLTVHEAAHAITSRWLGDNLAGKMGRITLNPLKHLSPLGTLMLFIAGFGWGNPVMINLYNYKHPKRDYLLSSLAGPVSNILVALISLGLMYAVNWLVPVIEDPGSWTSKVYFYSQLCLRLSMFINLVLAVINLVPIPPLDGSKIWPCLIPGMRPTHSGRTMWLWIIVLIVMLKTGATGRIISPVIKQVSLLAPEMRQVTEKRPGDFPAAFIAPQGSDVIEYDSWIEEDGARCYYISFAYSDAPSSLIDWLEHYIKENQWSTEPSELISIPWEVLEEEEGKSYTWQHEWTKPNGDRLEVILYRYCDSADQESSELIYGNSFYYVDSGE